MYEAIALWFVFVAVTLLGIALVDGRIKKRKAVVQNLQQENQELKKQLLRNQNKLNFYKFYEELSSNAIHK